MSQISSLYEETLPWQRAIGSLSLLLSLIGLMLLIGWMNTATDKGGLGKLDWGEYIFNFHPIFMYSALILGCFSAVLTYRLLPISKYIAKSIHGLIHTIAIICIILGLVTVFMGNGSTKHNTGHSYYPNLFSLHSFLGIGTVLVYVTNYILGLVHFVPSLNLIPLEPRVNFMPYHVALGMFSIFAATIAVETGIMELATELGCTYQRDGPDSNPVQGYYEKISLGCKLGNAVGVLVFVAVFLLFFAVRKVQHRVYDRDYAHQSEADLLL